MIQATLTFLTPWSDRLLRFWHWWIAELTRCARDCIDRIATLAWARCTISLTEKTSEVILEQGRSAVRFGPMPLCDGPHRLAEDPRSLQWPQDVFRRPVRLQLPDSWMLVRHVQLPRAAAPHLRDTIDLQFERHCPLPRELVYWDVELDPPDDDAGPRLKARLGMTRRADVDALLARLSEWGVRVRAVSQRTGEGNAFNFIATRRGRGPTLAPSGLNRRLAALALAFSIAIGTVGVTLQVRERQALEAAVAAAENAARPVTAMRDEVANHLEVLRAERALATRVRFPQLWSELTARLPDSVWIQQLDVEESSARLRGIAPAGLDLSALLLASPLITKADLASLQSTGLGTQQDRFDLVVTLLAPARK